MADTENVEKINNRTPESPAVAEAAVKEKTSSENSEYDSVDSYSDEEEQPVGKARSKASGLDSHSETEDCAVLEREEGDGQESIPQKKVDDDEDKKNPQYIPKRGTFYEHDDRTAEDIENQEEAEPEKADKEGTKKIWQDKKERWGHDRYNDQEQAPKSPSELIAIYGYDIRNEEGPPRARRRRRYGRGPNKYTRNWEDEEAYSKPAPARPPRPLKKERPRNSEEFPPLGASNDRSRIKSSSDSNPEIIEAQENNVQSKKPLEKQDPKKDQLVEQNQLSQSLSPNVFNNRPSSEHRNTQSEQVPSRSNQSPKIGTGRIINPKKEIKDSDYKGFTTKTRQQRGVRSESQKVLPPRNHRKENEYIQSQNFSNKNSNQNQITEMEREISRLNIHDGVYKGNRNNNAPSNQSEASNTQNRQGSVPPRLQNNEPKGSKRYSSLRQRSLPESNAPPVPANFSFYPNDYNSAAPPPATQQPILPTTIPPPALVPPQAPVSAAPPLLQAPFPAAAAFATPGPPQAFLQGPPPPFIAAPPAQPQLVSYVTQAQPAFVQGYQGQFNTVTQPADLYQPQGGITYYSADQQIAQRPVPLRRPKAAIPIVAPTDFNDHKEYQIQRDDGTNASETPQVNE